MNSTAPSPSSNSEGNFRLASRLPALELEATLPADASQTGYAYGPVRLYLAPSDQDEAVYLVVGDSIERWPHSDPMTLCS